jgi:hypothetical protein
MFGSDSDEGASTIKNQINLVSQKHLFIAIKQDSLELCK